MFVNIVLLFVNFPARLKRVKCLSFTSQRVDVICLFLKLNVLWMGQKCQCKTKNSCFDFGLFLQSIYTVFFSCRTYKEMTDISILHITNKHCICKALQTCLVSMTTGTFCSLISRMLWEPHQSILHVTDTTCAI